MLRLLFAAVMVPFVLSSALFNSDSQGNGAGSSQQNGGRQGGGHHEPHYAIPIPSSVAPSRGGQHHELAVRVGDHLYLSSMAPIMSFFNMTIVPGGIYNEMLQVLSQAGILLEQAGCTFSDVYDVVVWVTDVSQFREVDRALGDYATENKVQYKMAGHLKQGGPFVMGGHVELDVQAANCKWPQGQSHSQEGSQHNQQGQQEQERS